MTWGTFDEHYIDIMGWNSHLSFFLDKPITSDENRRTFY